MMEKFEHKQILKWIDEDKDEIVDFFSKLVQCKTPSTIGDTREAVSLIADTLTKDGISYEVLSHCKTMPNIVSSFEGASLGKHLMLNGHLDVMPAGKELGWIDDPWSGAVHDGRVWGRGTSDMKAGDTAMLFAFRYLYRIRDSLSGKLSLSLVADEETGWGRGTGFLFDKYPEKMIADCVLTGEPSDLGAISFASKGYMMLTIKISTRGAIAGYSNESKNAIEIAGDLIKNLKTLENIKVTLPSEISKLINDKDWCQKHNEIRGSNELKLLDKITVDVCTIQGGSLSVVIPADCKMTVSIVFPQGTDVDYLKEKLQDIMAKYPEAEMNIDGVDMPEMSDAENDFPNLIQDVAESIGLKRPIVTPDIAISDCRYWRYRGIPAYWYGPGGETCSAANESISIEDLLNTVRVHTLTAFEYLQ